MKKTLFALGISTAILLSSTAFAGGSISGYGTVRHESCEADNLLILSEETPNTFSWPYRVEEPEYCIHIYPDNPDVYPEYYPLGHRFYYTLPAAARAETGYYDGYDYLAPLDGFEDGERINFQFSITGGDSDTFLITDKLRDSLIFAGVSDRDEPVEDDEVPIPPAGFEDEVIVAFEAYSNPFSDTNMKTLEGQAAAELYRRAVLGGYPDGEFKGYRAVNRAEGAKFLLLARYGTVANVNGNGGFPDVLEGEWYAKYVVTAAKKGIINGYPNGLFKPADTINTAEFLKMLSKTFGLRDNLPYKFTDVDKYAWYAPYAGIAQQYNLFPKRGLYLNPNQNLTRDEVAVAIYQYLMNRGVELPVIDEVPVPEEPEIEAVKYTPHSFGAPGAPVTIELWGGLEEPFTRRLRGTLDELLEVYEDDIRIVWRHFPLPFHAEAYASGNAMECAEAQKEGVFWDYMGEIFEADSSELGYELYRSAAEKFGLDLAEFKTCLMDERYYGHIKYDSQESVAANISGSPTMFINGTKLAGAQSYDIIKEVIKENL